ncbi:MAG: nitroreductase family protein [Stackebrandtia sp.]
MSNSRHAETSQPLHPLLATRHSTRAFDPRARLSEAQVTALLEAARWAPSSGNTQPSRFIVGRKGTEVFTRVLSTLKPGNQKWAGQASLLIVAVRVAGNEKGPLPHAAYDLGQAMAHLVVQAQAEGLTVRQMAGFFPDEVSKEFDLPPELVPTAVAAVGLPGDPAALPEDLRGPDENPRRRKPLSELILAE